MCAAYSESLCKQSTKLISKVHAYVYRYTSRICLRFSHQNVFSVSNQAYSRGVHKLDRYGTNMLEMNVKQQINILKIVVVQGIDE